MKEEEGARTLLIGAKNSNSRRQGDRHRIAVAEAVVTRHSLASAPLHVIVKMALMLRVSEWQIAQVAGDILHPAR